MQKSSAYKVRRARTPATSSALAKSPRTGIPRDSPDGGVGGGTRTPGAGAEKQESVEKEVLISSGFNSFLRWKLGLK